MENSHIEWTDHTFNPWIGCTKVSPGCLHCYAEARDQRFGGGEHWGKGAPRQRTSAAYWKAPFQWNRECRVHGTRLRVFCASLADVFDDEVNECWRHDLFGLIRSTPFLDWQLLTKRPEKAKSYLAQLAADFGGDPETWCFPNVWLGVSVEDQSRADERIPILLSIPARVRFLSCEPLLESVSLPFTCFGNGSDTYGRMDGIHWVICGGESGPGARQMQLTWAYDLKHQCERAGVAFFMKQLGSNCMMNLVAAEGEHFRHFTGPGKGGNLDQLPEQLRVRQFPNVEVPA